METDFDLNPIPRSGNLRKPMLVPRILKLVTSNIIPEVILRRKGLAMASTLVMRGMLKKKILRDILMGTTAGWLVGAAWWFGVALPRRRRYEEFYRNYDDVAVSKVLKASFEED